MTSAPSPASLLATDIDNKAKWFGLKEFADYTGFGIISLPDVSINAPTNGQVLSYNASIGRWINSTGGSGGGVTNISVSAPLTGGPITSTGTIGITQSSSSTNGYLSSVDWNTFNNKQPAGAYISLTSLSATSPLQYNNTTGNFVIPVSTSLVDGYLSSSDWSSFNNKVNPSRALTINGVTQDLSADRTWTVTAVAIGGTQTFSFTTGYPSEEIVFVTISDTGVMSNSLITMTVTIDGSLRDVDELEMESFQTFLSEINPGVGFTVGILNTTGGAEGDYQLIYQRA